MDAEQRRVLFLERLKKNDETLETVLSNRDIFSKRASSLVWKFFGLLKEQLIESELEKVGAIANCELLTDQYNKLRKSYEEKSHSASCDLLTEQLNNLKNLYEEKYQSNWNLLAGQFNNLKDHYEGNAKVTKMSDYNVVDTTNYSERVLQDNVGNLPTVEKSYSMVVAIVEPCVDNGVITDIIKSKIDPVNLGISINVCKPTGDNGVLIKCKKQKDLELIRDVLIDEKSESNVPLKIKIHEKMKPRVIIYNVDEEIDGLGVCRGLINQNGLQDCEKLITHVFTMKSKRSGFRHHVVQIDPEIFSRVLGLSKIHIGWCSLGFSEFIDLKKCYKCCDYGHFAKYCKSEQSFCSYCSGNHLIGECIAEIPSCINCKRRNGDSGGVVGSDHAVDDPKCPRLIEWKTVVRSRIGYA